MTDEKGESEADQFNVKKAHEKDCIATQTAIAMQSLHVFLFPPATSLRCGA